jgi:hypothetical protein
MSGGLPGSGFAPAGVAADEEELGEEDEEDEDEEEEEDEEGGDEEDKEEEEDEEGKDAGIGRYGYNTCKLCRVSSAEFVGADELMLPMLGLVVMLAVFIVSMVIVFVAFAPLPSPGGGAVSGGRGGFVAVLTFSMGVSV